MIERIDVSFFLDERYRDIYIYFYKQTKKSKIIKTSKHEREKIRKEKEDESGVFCDIIMCYFSIRSVED